MTETIHEIRRLLWRAGPAGMTSREIARRTRAFRRLTTRERALLLDRMVQDGLCAPCPTGRTVRYVDGELAGAQAAPGASREPRGWIRRDGDGCHIWQGARDARGVAVVEIGGAAQTVAWLRYQLEVGPVVGTAALNFICGNGRDGCCNPFHLRAAAP